MLWTFKASYEDYPYTVTALFIGSLEEKKTVHMEESTRYFQQLLYMSYVYTLSLWTLVCFEHKRLVALFISQTLRESPEDDEGSDGSTSTLCVYFGRKGEQFCTI